MTSADIGNYRAAGEKGEEGRTELHRVARASTNIPSLAHSIPSARFSTGFLVSSFRSRFSASLLPFSPRVERLSVLANINSTGREG